MEGLLWDFLGVSFKDGIIDLSKATINKIKGKIRRKCDALYRWKVKKGATNEQAIKATIKTFNKKFYESGLENELTWSRWFFPLLSTDEGLKIVDGFLEKHLRHISTGKFTKKNYELVPYKKLKELGFKPLVSEFWKFKELIKEKNN